MTYKTLVNDICSNDAAIEAIAVALTVYGWAKSAYAAGKAARAWWETDDVIAPLLRLLGQVIWLIMVLAWSYFAGGKAKAHWEFITAVVDDGVGLYGPSPMGDALVAWGLNKAQELGVVTVGASEYMANQLNSGYERLQARVFVAS